MGATKAHTVPWDCDNQQLEGLVNKQPILQLGTKHNPVYICTLATYIATQYL